MRDKTGLLFGLNVIKPKEGEGEGGGRGESSTSYLGLANSAATPHLVGDDGAGWRSRALKRAKEEAHRTGKSLNEVRGSGLLLFSGDF